METRRVVITGLGAITPLGNTAGEFWEGVTAGRSGVGLTQVFDTSKLPTRMAAEVKDFNPDQLFGRRDARRMDRYAQMALAAAREAIADAKLPEDPDVRDRTGAIVATGIGGIITIEDTTFEIGPKQAWDRVSPFFVPMLMGNAASAQISMNYGLRGPVFAVSSACASANDAFCVAFDKIVLGEALAIVTGGSEAAVIPTAMGGFASMKAMSTRNDDPTHASRPFDKGRDGFVLAEGAAALVLERADAAKARGARVHARLAGAGGTADGYDLVAPHPEGEGAARAIGAALRDAGLSPTDIGHVNAHATSTPVGDTAEAAAIRSSLGEHVMVSATKGQTGHLLGAAGALESVFTVLALREQIVPATANLDDPDDDAAVQSLDIVRNEPRRATFSAAVNDSFGFGGHNIALVFTTA